MPLCCGADRGLGEPLWTNRRVPGPPLPQLSSTTSDAPHSSDLDVISHRQAPPSVLTAQQYEIKPKMMTVNEETVWGRNEAYVCFLNKGQLCPAQ